MYTVILLLAALIGVVFGFFIFRVLVRSKWFAHLIGGAVEPPPVTSDEVIQRLKAAKAGAHRRVGECNSAACKSRQIASELRRELRRQRPEL